MKKLRFADGMKPLTADMDQLHDLTEEALGTVIQALTGGSSGKVLFSNLPPAAVYDAGAGTLTITVLAQHYALSGVVVQQQTTEPSVAAGTTDLQVGVFLIAGTEGVVATRNFLTLDPASDQIIQQDLTHELFTLNSSRVFLTTVSDLTTQVPEPTLGADDLGFVRLGTVRFTQATGAVIIDKNTVDTYSLPTGTTVPTTAHGASHLPGGVDEVAVATLSGSSSGGSAAGLLPAGGLSAILGAVQSVVAADSAPYIQVLTDGNNAPDGSLINAKRTTLALHLHQSLTTTDSGGQTALTVAHKPATPLNGTSDQSARADHGHALVESGLIFQQITLDMTLAKKGSITPFTVTPAASGSTTATIAKIISVVAMWQPANIKAGLENRSIETGWSVFPYAGSTSSVGCRVLVTGKNTLNLEIGSLGAAFASGAAIQSINDVVGGGANAWTNPLYAGGEFTTTGKIFLFVTALRAGSTALEAGQ